MVSILEFTFNILHAFQLETEGQSFKAIQDLWNSAAAGAGNSNFSVHPSHDSPMNCNPEPALQIGYVHTKNKKNLIQVDDKIHRH